MAFLTPSDDSDAKVEIATIRIVETLDALWEKLTDPKRAWPLYLAVIITLLAIVIFALIGKR